METIRYDFTDDKGGFVMDKPSNVSYLYLPVGSADGVMGSISPDGHGDLKLSQNRFFLEPAIAEGLQESMSSRNFWLDIEGAGLWSAFGFSAGQLAKRGTGDEEENHIKAGLVWQEISRKHTDTGLKAQILSFAPESGQHAELMRVTVKNEGKLPAAFTATAAVPVYGRGADHIRDHRHVTALLNRIFVDEDGVRVEPTMVFDERGHLPTKETYGVYGRDCEGRAPDRFFATVEDFVGEGGNLLQPKGAKEAYLDHSYSKGAKLAGSEAMGGLRFTRKLLMPGEKVSYFIVLSFDGEGLEYLDKDKFDQAFRDSKKKWEDRRVISTGTGDKSFDGWMNWVSAQPSMRKYYGCSFLPWHDYGRGGRGWRDLWQDSLALILRDPGQTREDLVRFTAGIRIDGTNATIIGSKPGEFIADRNGIARVWMDHGYWPMLTMNLYLSQTGDTSVLFEDQPFFKDNLIKRGEGRDESFPSGQETLLKDQKGEVVRASVLEHLLLEQVCQFYDVGDHGHMRLRGADWNDALDMAPDKGESVAFTGAYAGSLELFASMLFEAAKGQAGVPLLKETADLLNEKTDGIQPQKMREILMAYCDKTAYKVSGETVSVPLEEIARNMEEKSALIKAHIQETERVSDGQGRHWLNGYYDNHGRQVEGCHEKGVRMMLTGQVFPILSGVADDALVQEISKAADYYLYEPKLGGYRLNTDFGEVKLDMGRMFGFAYGHKENGAVFSHMAVMYAYALYHRGFVREGFKVIDALYRQSANVAVSRIYPGIPEYFGPDGRGMYTYLTGAASWLVMLVFHEMFGVRGQQGDMELTPRLLLSQFDSQKKARVSGYFHGTPVTLVYTNPYSLDYGDYDLAEVRIGDQTFPAKNGTARIPGRIFDQAEGRVLIQASLE